MVDSSKFFFTRLQYESGDWDVDQRMPSNVLNSLIEYTTLPVDTQENIIPLSSSEIFRCPFCYLSRTQAGGIYTTGDKKISKNTFAMVVLYLWTIAIMTSMAFSQNHSKPKWIGSFPKSLKKIPATHPLYSVFFKFDGPPTTAQELNGWGDDIVHDYLKAIEINGKIGVLYSNKDYGCEWDYDFRNKRFYSVDNTRFSVNIVMYALTR